MKIIHVIRTLDPAAGGPPQVIIRLAAAQANLGHELHVVSYGSSEAQERVQRELERVPYSGKLHIHSLAADLAWHNHIPYCFRPAGMLDPWSLEQKRWKKRLAMTLGLRRTLKRAAFIHALNADEAKLIEPLQLGIRSVIIPNGVFLEEIEPLPAPGTFFSAHPQLRGRRFVLFIARLHYKKGRLQPPPAKAKDVKLLGGKT